MFKYFKVITTLIIYRTSALNFVMSLQIPEDVEYLEYCETPHNRYELSKRFSSPYSSICFHIKKLVKMQFLFVVKEENGHGPGKVKYYLTTDKGRAIVRGHMEAMRE